MKTNKKNKTIDIKLMKSYTVLFMAMTGCIVAVLIVFIYPPYSFDIVSDIKMHKGIKLTSPAFQNNELIPSKYTCDGENINPELDISSVPSETQSLVMIMDDPDTDNGTYSHWVLSNINPLTKSIKENSTPIGSIVGLNSNKTNQYIGPCPPNGEHRYFFKLYALSTVPSFDKNISQEKIMNSIQDSIIEQTELVGLYRK